MAKGVCFANFDAVKRSFDGYERLGRGMFGCSSLWMGPDHLLYVRGKGLIFPVLERYSRYRYGDIESFSVAPTSAFSTGLFLYGGGFLACLAVILFQTFYGQLGAWFGMVGMTFLPVGFGCLLMLIRQLMLGRRCRCEIQTDLQRERIAPLSSYRIAIAALDKVQPMLEAADVTSDRSVADIIGTKPVKIGWALPMTFVVVIVYSLAATWLGFSGGSIVTGFAIVLGLIAVLMLTFSVGSFTRHSLPESVVPLLVAIIVLLAMTASLTFWHYVHEAANDPSFTTDEFGFFRALANLSRNTAFVGLGLMLLVVSVVGLVVSLRWRRWVKRSQEA